MPNTATLPLNGKPRKQLSDQLDRLDDLIDVLGDGLNDAVVTAMRDGARQAVREALVEVLTNPDFLSVLQSSAPVSGVPTPTSSTLLERLRSYVCKIGSAVGCLANAVKERFRKTLAAARARLRTVRESCKAKLIAARSGGFFLSRLILTATLVSALAGAAAYHSPLEMVTALGMFCGAIGTICVQLGYRARRFLRGVMSMALSPAVRLT